MATIDITCPNCGNTSKGPDTVRGKKIRCKNCEHVFLVPEAATVAARKPTKPAEEKTLPPQPVEDEDEIAKIPFGMVEENLAPRCPHCALPLDPPDSAICLHCGYHMRKRTRAAKKVVFEHTFGDYVMWHLPTVGYFFLICILLGLDALCVIRWYPDLVENSLVGDVFGEPLSRSCMSLWTVVISLFFIWKMGKFIIVKRLMHFTPPEEEKKMSQGFMG
ncbi:MAG TPA: hypothetical protein VKS79_21715 [Gemmataceae bacterium]|nr:hypothetical protein [Gemmataceae bacterium]